MKWTLLWCLTLNITRQKKRGVDNFWKSCFNAFLRFQRTCNVLEILFCLYNIFCLLTPCSNKLRSKILQEIFPKVLWNEGWSNVSCFHILVPGTAIGILCYVYHLVLKENDWIFSHFIFCLHVGCRIISLRCKMQRGA